MARGSGPVSTTSAVPSPAASTRPSPCPTSHTTARHPGGGHPVRTRVNGAGRHTAKIIASTHSTHSQGCRSTLRTTGTRTTRAAASTNPPPQPPGQSNSAPGSAAPVRATPAIHSAGQPAHHDSAWAAGNATGATARAAKPSTVAGATATSASRLQGTATRPTRAASTATTGAQTAWAAAAAAITSAIRGGTRRR